MDYEPQQERAEVSEGDKEETYSESMAGQAPTSASIEIRDMPVGTTISLRNGAIAEVTANPADGGWLFIQYLQNEKEPSKVGTEDMVFCVDVMGIV